VVTSLLNPTKFLERLANNNQRPPAEVFTQRSRVGQPDELPLPFLSDSPAQAYMSQISNLKAESHSSTPMFTVFSLIG
jgi:hypothetical protein